MNHAGAPEVFAGLRIFEKTCVYCGARLRVLARQSADPKLPHSYDCPSCGKEYELESVAAPHVRLLAGRTDGKDDRYQETIF